MTYFTYRRHLLLKAFLKKLVFHVTKIFLNNEHTYKHRKECNI